MSNKIRFIDSKYNTLFEINDGESVTIISSDGKPSIFECVFIDDYHFYLGGRRGTCYHICQFAELMERIGSTYQPKV